MLINRRENGPKLDIKIKNVYGRYINYNTSRYVLGRKIPYMLIIEDKDVEANVVLVRRRGEGDLEQMPLATFIDKILDDVSTFRLD